MSLRETTGIYQILNKQNLKCYIGSTRRNFHDRFKDHKRSLKKNKHHSKHLQAAWNKYGEEVFEFNVLEVIDKSLDKIYFLQREQYWLDKLESHNKKFGYNVNPKTELTPIQANPEYYAEHFANLRNRGGYLIQSPNSEEWIEVTNLNKYAKENNVSRKSLSKVLNNKSHVAYGYRVKFLDKTVEESINRKVRKIRVKRPKCIKGWCPVNYYYVENTITKERILISNLIRFSKQHNLNPSNLRSTLLGSRYQHKNYKLISLDEEKNNHKQPKWLVVTPDNKDILVDRLNDFCKINKLRYDCLSQTAHNNKSFEYKGYRCYLLDKVLDNTQEYPKCDFTYKVYEPNGNLHITNSLTRLGDKLGTISGKMLAHVSCGRSKKYQEEGWIVVKL